MLFSSVTFLYIFLPVVCALYICAKKELHNIILLAASLLFYAWGDVHYLALMLFVIVINYLGAIFIDKYYVRRKFILCFTIILNLSILVYFKYFNFIFENLNNLFNTNIKFLEIIMPIGISFYIFQAMSYLIDVYRGECKVQKDFYKLALYISLFPQLVAGPIVKYHDVAEQIEARDVNFNKVQYGVKRFIIGLSKKVIIANTLGCIADKIFVQAPDTFSSAIAWLGAIAYTFQLYFDFSGYSDMAIGLGYLFGFKFMENFNYPYISKSITEFWRRWHISLSTWFKQYVYIPLGGNRINLSRTCLNLGIVFFLTGLWHGASWNFVIWGLWNGFFIIFEKLTGWHHETENRFINIIKHCYTVLIFVLGWVIFRADNMSYAAEYLKNMFGLAKVHDVAFALPYYIDTYECIILFIAVICSLPLFKNILNLYEKSKILYSTVNVLLLCLFFYCTILIVVSTYNPFIYFRF